MSINNWEDKENWVEEGKKSNDSLELKFRKNFVFDSLDWKNQVDKNSFISDLMTNNSISSDLEKKLKEFRASHQEEFSDIDEEEETLDILGSEEDIDETMA